MEAVPQSESAVCSSVSFFLLFFFLKAIDILSWLFSGVNISEKTDRRIGEPGGSR